MKLTRRCIEEDPEEYDVSQLDPNVLSVIEADSFWCLSKLLDGIQVRMQDTLEINGETEILLG